MSKKYKLFERVTNNNKYTQENIPQRIQSLGKGIPIQNFTFVGDRYDNQYYSYVGRDNSSIGQTGYQYFFSIENMKYLSDTIHRKLLEAGHNIVITDEVLGDVMSSINRDNTPKIGNIYTLFTIPSTNIRDDVQNMNDRVVNTIVSNILDTEDAKKWNESLNIWDTVYGDFNRKGLRSHSIIRKKEKDIMKGQFNENY